MSDRINFELVPQMISKMNVSRWRGEGERGDPNTTGSDLREQRCNDGTGDFLFSLKLHLNKDWTATAHKHSPNTNVG